jgi:hypothetical protein
MWSRRSILQIPAFFQVAKSAPASDRDYWVATNQRIAEPVLTNLSQGKLRANMPVEATHHNEADRRLYTYLEAIGRLLTGIAPWLESGASDGPEGDLRRRYADLARASIHSAVDPVSADYMNFSHGAQPLVDAAFLAQAVLRAPTELWKKLDSTAQQNLIKALQIKIPAHYVHLLIRHQPRQILPHSLTHDASLAMMHPEPLLVQNRRDMR